MLEGGIRCSGADFAIAISGIAGPDGGTADKPVGTVWFAIGGLDSIQTSCRRFLGDRDAVREQAVAYALTAATAQIKLTV
jgi:nicotinamide-nucleotide amidase